MGVNLIVFAAFWALVASTFLRQDGWERLKGRGAGNWLLDGAGLLVQGVAVPLLETGVLYWALGKFWPAGRGALALPGWAAFLLNFALVDYLYYWNHRFLHGRLWSWHAVHHTAERLDVLVASRNTLLSPLLIVYVWVNALCLYLLVEPAPFLLAAALTAALDLWRHSEVWPKEPGPALGALSKVLVTPLDHAWHHSSDRMASNFGANFKLWDRWHGTLHEPGEYPESLGIELSWSLGRKLLVPRMSFGVSQTDAADPSGIDGVFAINPGRSQEPAGRAR